MTRLAQIKVKIEQKKRQEEEINPAQLAQEKMRRIQHLREQALGSDIERKSHEGELYLRRRRTKRQ